MLDHETTIKLIKLAQSGQEDAKETLVNENSPLIKSVIKPYRNKGIEYDDLYQLGSLGFIKAIKNFDENFGVKFSTYAVPMVAGEVKRFMRDDGSIKVSRALKYLNIQITKYINDYRQKNNSEPTLKEIAKNFNTDEQEIVFAMDSRKSLLSLDERQDENSPKSRTIMECLEDDKSPDTMIEGIMLKDLLKELPERDKKLIGLRYYEDKTQSEIAELMGVSQVQISRLECKILEKLKSRLAE